MLNKTQDLIFSETIRRNFSECPIDPSYFVYDNNQADGGPGRATKGPLKKPHKAFVDYHANLQNTEDAYSDSEIVNYSKSR